MSLFTPTTRTRFSQEGEEDFNDDYPCILDRISLAIVAGTSEYELPDYVKAIRRVTWVGGWKIYPISHRKLREWNLTGSETSGRPYNYIYNNIGRNTIKLFVTPANDIPSVTDVWGADILTGVIVEFWRASDYSTKVIPSFFSNPLVSAYTNSKLYSIEGKGQNLKASKYFKSKYDLLSQTYSDLLNYLARGPQRTTFGQSSYSPTVLYPHLSVSKFGVSVDEGQ